MTMNKTETIYDRAVRESNMISLINEMADHINMAENRYGLNYRDEIDETIKLMRDVDGRIYAEKQAYIAEIDKLKKDLTWHKNYITRLNDIIHPADDAGREYLRNLAGREI